MQQTPLEQHIASIIEESVRAHEYRLVKVRYGGAVRPRLQIMVERLDGAMMTVGDCASLSRRLSVVLDVEDPISDAYTLEVSSPGIDRPLMCADDFARFSGFDARIITRRPIDGQKRFKGCLGGLQENCVMLATEKGECRLPLESILDAKLLLSDALIQAARRHGLS